MWNLKGKKLVDLDSIFLGHPTKIGNDDYSWSKKGLIPLPKDFKGQDGYKSSAILSIKFITKNYYLRFTTYIPYAILYKLGNPKPIKYLPLGTQPFPSVNDYSRDQSIDTSPSAHILVMGKQYAPGIIVYKFNPKTLILNKTWVSK